MPRRPGPPDPPEVPHPGAHPDPPAHPVLLRRGPDSVQLGWQQERGIVVAGLEPVEVERLRRQARSPAPPPRARLRARERARDRAETLAGLVREHAAPAPLPRASTLGGCRVLVAGDGVLTWQAASLLRTAGVGRVDLGGAAADDLEQQLAGPGGLRVGSDRSGGTGGTGSLLPDLVVLVGHLVLAPERGAPWLRCGVPVLPVVVDADRVVVGPVVGSWPGPCLHCLDLVRTDLDDAWPALAAQVATTHGSPAVLPDGVPDPALTSLAAAALAMVVTGQLSGRSLPPGVSVETSLPWPRLDHRRWPRHPDCPHHRHTGQRGGRDDIGGGPSETSGSSRETMTG